MPGNARRPLADRLWDSVDKSGGQDACWPWTASTTLEGYGKLSTGGHSGRLVLAHRTAYEIMVGPIPVGLHLDHLCRVPPCCNPGHLEPVTHRENILRGIGPSALNARKTHCPSGHPYSSDNTYIFPRNGSRQCRICRRRYHAEYIARRDSATVWQ